MRPYTNELTQQKSFPASFYRSAKKMMMALVVMSALLSFKVCFLRVLMRLLGQVMYMDDIIREHNLFTSHCSRKPRGQKTKKLDLSWTMSA